MLRFCGGVRMVLRATFGIHIAVTYRSFSCHWGLLTYWKFHQHPRLRSGRAGTQAGLNKVFLCRRPSANPRPHGHPHESAGPRRDQPPCAWMEFWGPLAKGWGSHAPSQDA